MAQAVAGVLLGPVGWVMLGVATAAYIFWAINRTNEINEKYRNKRRGLNCPPATYSNNDSNSGSNSNSNSEERSNDGAENLPGNGSNGDDDDGDDDEENDGKFKDSELDKHHDKHGKELGSKDKEHYKRQAEGFYNENKKKMKWNSNMKPVDGKTPNVKRFKNNGKYIDVQKTKSGINRIISFGKQ